MKQFKLLWAVPVMALILFAFAEPKYVSADNSSSVSQNDDKGKTASGVILGSEGEKLQGAIIVVANTTTGTISDQDGKFSLKGLKPDDELVISYVGYITVKMKAGENVKVQMERNVIKVAVAETGQNMAPPPPPPPPPTPENLKIGSPGSKVLYIIDGEIKDYTYVDKIDTKTIEKVEVLKDKSAVQLYGEKAKDGVVLITTKKGSSGKGEKIKTSEKVEVYGPANHEEKNDGKFVAVEEMPQFIGGGEALGTFLKKETANAKEKGMIKVFFTVNADGDIDKIKVDDNVSKVLQEQAWKVMKSMPNWIPGKQNGKNVKVDMEMNILF
jgi:TonB-dependent SusC/RagA subfamily outer membrane receptor